MQLSSYVTVSCCYVVDDSGMRAAFPDDFETLATNQNARRRRREKMKPNTDVSKQDFICFK